MIGRIPPHLRWGGLVVGFLGMSVVIQLTAVFMSSREPLGLVENYEQKSANWDEHRAQLAKNEALGWQVDVRTRAIQGGAELIVELTDGFGERIEAAEVSAVAFHNANAGAKLRVDLPELAGGGYGRALPLERAGLYEIQLEVLHGGERFTAVVRESVAVGG